MIDDINNFETESNIGGGEIIEQKKLIENEFEEQIEQMRKVKINIGIIQENMIGSNLNNYEKNNNL